MGWARRRSKATYGTVVTTLTAMLAGGTAVMPAAAQSASTALPESAVATAAETGEAPNEELAKAAAKESGQPVEATNLRGERRDVFANKDGSFTAREYTQPVRTQQGGDWVPVDDTLVKQGDGTWAPKAATVRLEFSDGGQGPFARMSRVGREYALTWQGGVLPKPTVEGSTVRYAEVFPGVDLTVRAGTEGFSHYFVVKTAEAAANPKLDSLELGLTTKGLTATETPDGALKVVDSAVGGTVFEAGGASMWDSSVTAGASAPALAPAARSLKAATVTKPALDAADGGRKAAVDIDVAKGKLTLRPDLKLLRGKGTTYPVVIDPTPRTQNTSAWTSVMSGMSTEQDWKFADDAGVGRCPSDQTPASCSGIGVRRTLFSFPMSFYKGKQILSSTFSARLVKNYWNDNKAEPIDLYRIGGANYTVTSASDWSNTSGSWTNYLLTVDKAITPTSCGSQANLHFSNGDLLTDTRAAATGGWNTMSLGLKAKDESAYAGWKRICGNAYLSITYNTPPLQVANSTMTSDPGGKCVTDPAKAPLVDGLPMLRGEAKDPDHTSTSSDPVQMQYQVFYRDTKNVEQSYFATTGYKSPNPGTLFNHQVTSPPAATGIGMYYPTASPSPMVYQRATPDAGPNTANVPFDAKGRKILVGDWNADGIDTLGTYDASLRTFELWNDNSFTNPTRVTFGSAGDIPVVGDWNGDGRDTVGVWRPSNHFFYLNNETSNSVTDISFVYGASGMTPLVGDWNGDGVDTIGMYYPTDITFYIRNFNSAGGNSYEVRYGSPGDQPVIGDWNGDKTDSIGVWRESNHYYYLNNEHTNNVTDISFVYGANGMIALSGNWMPGIPTTTTISWQARAYDGEAWGPWSSANGAGRCVVRRDATVPAKPVVDGAHYKAGDVWHDGIGIEDTFTFTAADGDVVGYRYAIDGASYPALPTTGGKPMTMRWTPTWSGRHYIDVEAYDGAGKTSSLASYSFLVANGRVAQWDLADAAGTTDVLDATGNTAAVPSTGVTFGNEGRGGKADPVARFDGTPEAYITAADKAPDASDKAIVDTQASLSVSAWVKPSALTGDMTVVSQDGTDEAGLNLGYDAASSSWSFATPDADGEKTTSWAARVPAGPDAVGKWVHLTGVFDAKAVGGPQLRLYVDDGDPATPTGTATAARTTSWEAKGAFQIGRALSKGQYGANFNGDMSEVRVYNRPVTTAEIAEFQSVNPARKAYWQFETDPVGGAVSNVDAKGLPLVLSGATVYRKSSPKDSVLVDQGHLVLDGIDDSASTTGPVVGGDKSFTVTARVRLSNVDSASSQTVLSLPGQNTDRLAVRYDGATKRWKVVLTDSDSATAQKSEAVDLNTLPEASGGGSHLAVVYDAVVRELRLYVDAGNPVTVKVESPAAWASTGGLQVGRSMKAGQYLSGAVDEVRAYDGALAPDVIRQASALVGDSSI